MSMTVQISGPTVKVLHHVQQQAFRAGDVRVLKRVAALLELRGHTIEEGAETLGLSVRTLYRWLQAFILEGVSGLW